jgi:SAM-dependent methyltransferase
MSVDGKSYWERAAELGYSKAMFGSPAVERHVNGRLHRLAVDIGLRLGLDRSSRILDLGCGDGTFANGVLAGHFQSIDGFDLSEPSIHRAQAGSPGPQIRFQVRDVTQLDFAELPTYDGAFLIGILHHIKPSAPKVIKALRGIARRVVVLEPNGNHLLRRLLELTPSYKEAGEASFRGRDLCGLFEAAGYSKIVHFRCNIFPNFTPEFLFRLIRPLEPAIEGAPGLRALCTVDMFGFRADDEPSSLPV